MPGDAMGTHREWQPLGLSLRSLKSPFSRGLFGLRFHIPFQTAGSEHENEAF
jgi:hypothetical protein